MHGTLDLFNWTDAKVDLLRRLIVMKMSSGQIASEMGTTRGSIVGKANRLGLRFDSDSPHRRRKSMEMRLARNGIRPRPSRLPPAAPEPDALRIQFEDLRSDTCRWPVGEYPYTYCGHEPFAGKPYCAHHCGIAYVAPSARIREPRPR